MGWPIVIVSSGGLPVTEVTSGFGTPVEVASNGFGTPVTVVASGGLPVVGTGGGSPQPPAGFVFLTRADGTYLTNASGAYLLQKVP